MAKLINGNGNPAIYAAEDADLIASLVGNVTCISNVGNKYAATEEDATTIRLDDGVIITKEGRRIQLEAGESDTFYIPTGTSGQTNYYIIGYKLVQNADSTQVAEKFVQKMNSSSETITEDTFRSGATEVYVSVYRVTQVGFTIDSISGLLPELLDNASIKEDIEQIYDDLTPELIYFDGDAANFITVYKLGREVIVTLSLYNITSLDGSVYDHMPIPQTSTSWFNAQSINNNYRLVVDLLGNLTLKTAGGAAIASAVNYVNANFTYICRES